MYGMNFSLGQYWGKKYNELRNFRAYINFVLKENIKFSDFRKHWEILHDPNMYNYFIPRKGNIIYDIGSQFGDYALLWEKRYGAFVYAFELLRENYKEMLRDLKLNKSKIESFNFAIGNGEVLFYTVKGNMAVNEYSWNHVKSVKLDYLIYDRLYKIPDLIKIDSEGFEYKILEGSDRFLKEHSPKIIIETHSKELREKCHKFLSERNYLLVGQGRTVFNKSGNEIINLFYSKVVV